MPYRRLPKTDAARIKTLQTIIENDDVYTVGNKAVDWKTLNAARACYDKLKVAHIHYRNDFASQSRESKKYMTLQKTARMFVSHFIQVLNMSMQRGEIKESYKPLYGLEVGDYNVPQLNSDIQLATWGEKIINGEKQRLKKGGVPIYNPTIAKVAVHYDIFRAKYEQRKRLLKNTATSHESVVQLRESADKVILDIWNQVEAHYADLPEAERLDKCRKMGVIYYYRKGEKNS